MVLAARMKKLFDTYKVQYRVYPHKRINRLQQIVELLNIEAKSVLTTQLLVDKQGLLLAIYPLSKKIDFTKLKLQLERNLIAVSAIEVNRVFSDCEAGCWPPIGQSYGLDIIIDPSIKQNKLVYFSSGSYTSTVQMHVDDYLYLNLRAKQLDFTAALDENSDDYIETKTQILDGLDLPELPPIALQILQLSVGSQNSVQDLVEIVSQDKLIQQQIMLYTQLPFVQNQSQTAANNVQEIVEHVLGFDMVSHIALGVAAGRVFSEQQSGTEYVEFWRHAFYAAAYAQRITQLVAPELRLDPAISYLAGLFHNFGLLLFSQLFKPEYALLKKWMQANPKVSIAVLEKRLLGMGRAFNIVRAGHARLGEWLLRNWRLPESICEIAKEHHSLTYKGKYAAYVKIIQIANQLLREDGIGDGSAGGINEQLLESLGLNASQVIDAVTNIRTGALSLDQMAAALTNQ